MAFFAPEIGIDLGTSNTLVYVRGRGVVISEPTIVVVETRNRRIIRAIGDEARYLIGRTGPELTALLPMKDGVVDDFDCVEALIRYFMRKAIGASHVFKPKAVVTVPCGLTPVNRRAVEEAAKTAGAKQVFLVEKPYAAAIGTGLPVYEPVGSMIVDIGGGTTDVALISLGGIVTARSIAMGGMRMDRAIADVLRSENLIISASTAENLRIDLGSAIPTDDVRRVRVRGRDGVMNVAKDLEFTSRQCYEALRDPLAGILRAIRDVLKLTPPELAGDVMRGGIHLTGGAAQLFGMDRFIADQLGLPVMLATDPMDNTIMGIGYLVENMQLLSNMSKQMQANA